MKIKFQGYFHPKNEIGIRLLNSEKFQVVDVNYDFIVTSNSFDGDLCGPHIDFNIVCNQHRKIDVNMLSQWLCDLTMELNSFINPIMLPFPVDIDRFSPSSKGGNPIFYFKNRDEIIKNKLMDIIDMSKFDLFIYGEYKEEQYLDSIKKAPYAIWLGTHESQGFAFQECLSCNTPIIVLDAKSLRDETNKVGYKPWENFRIDSELKSTSASFFDERCGIKTNIINFEEDFNSFIKNLDKYEPRNFIIDTLSPDICRRRWIEYFEKKII